MGIEYIIYADESEDKGQYYSNFFGGALIQSQHEIYIISALEEAKAEQNLFKEIKWSKVTEQYLDKYIAVMDTFFDLIQGRYIKVRIMFTQNAYQPTKLEKYHYENAYFLLYYQFIKHGFGLRHCNPDGKVPIRLRILLDNIPDKNENKRAFKNHLLALNNEERFRSNRIQINYDGIGEIDSKDHVILQCLDVVLGAMQFRLNDKHKEKLPGKRRRGKRTIAKEKLYKHIRSRICEWYPNFNIGVSTSDRGDWHNRWLHPYSHWRFVSADSELDRTMGKRFDK